MLWALTLGFILKHNETTVKTMPMTINFLFIRKPSRASRSYLHGLVLIRVMNCESGLTIQVAARPEKQGTVILLMFPMCPSEAVLMQKPWEHACEDSVSRAVLLILTCDLDQVFISLLVCDRVFASWMGLDPAFVCR